MTGNNYKVGDLVWAKMKGFRPWPGRITTPLSKDQKRKSFFFIYFYGSNDFGWISSKNIESHSHILVLKYTKNQKSSSVYLKAVEEIVNASKQLKTKNASKILNMKAAAKANHKSQKNENKIPCVPKYKHLIQNKKNCSSNAPIKQEDCIQNLEESATTLYRKTNKKVEVKGSWKEKGTSTSPIKKNVVIQNDPASFKNSQFLIEGQTESLKNVQLLADVEENERTKIGKCAIRKVVSSRTVGFKSYANNLIFKHEPLDEEESSDKNLLLVEKNKTSYEENEDLKFFYLNVKQNIPKGNEDSRKEGKCLTHNVLKRISEQNQFISKLNIASKINLANERILAENSVLKEDWSTETLTSLNQNAPERKSLEAVRANPKRSCNKNKTIVKPNTCSYKKIKASNATKFSSKKKATVLTNSQISQNSEAKKKSLIKNNFQLVNFKKNKITKKGKTSKSISLSNNESESLFTSIVIKEEPLGEEYLSNQQLLLSGKNHALITRESKKLTNIVLTQKVPNLFNGKKKCCVKNIVTGISLKKQATKSSALNKRNPSDESTMPRMNVYADSYKKKLEPTKESGVSQGFNATVSGTEICKIKLHYISRENKAAAEKKCLQKNKVADPKIHPRNFKESFNPSKKRKILKKNIKLISNEKSERVHERKEFAKYNDVQTSSAEDKSWTKDFALEPEPLDRKKGSSNGRSVVSENYVALNEDGNKEIISKQVKVFILKGKYMDKNTMSIPLKTQIIEPSFVENKCVGAEKTMCSNESSIQMLPSWGGAAKMRKKNQLTSISKVNLNEKKMAPAKENAHIDKKISGYEDSQEVAASIQLINSKEKDPNSKDYNLKNVTGSNYNKKVKINSLVSHQATVKRSVTVANFDKARCHVEGSSLIAENKLLKEESCLKIPAPLRLINKMSSKKLKMSESSSSPKIFVFPYLIPLGKGNQRVKIDSKEKNETENCFKVPVPVKQFSKKPVKKQRISQSNMKKDYYNCEGLHMVPSEELYSAVQNLSNDKNKRLFNLSNINAMKNLADQEVKADESIVNTLCDYVSRPSEAEIPIAKRITCKNQSFCEENAILDKTSKSHLKSVLEKKCMKGKISVERNKIVSSLSNADCSTIETFEKQNSSVNKKTSVVNAYVIKAPILDYISLKESNRSLEKYSPEKKYISKTTSTKKINLDDMSVSRRRKNVKHSMKFKKSGKKIHKKGILNKKKVSENIIKKRLDSAQFDSDQMSSDYQVMDNDLLNLNRTIPPNYTRHSEAIINFNNEVKASSVFSPEKDQCLIEKFPPMHKIGFIGIGKIGQRIVKSLLDTGHSLVLWNRTESRCDMFPEVDIAENPENVIKSCDVIFSCLSGPEASKEVIFGKCGVLQGFSALLSEPDSKNIKKGFVEFTSLDPATSICIGKEINLKGGRFLESKLNGAQIDGFLSVLAAGDKSLFDDCKSCFNAIGKYSLYLGDEVGVAAQINISQTALFGVIYAGMMDTLALNKHLGIKGKSLLQVLSEGVLRDPSTFLQMGKAIAQHDVSSNLIKNLQKNLKMGITLGRKMKLQMPVAEAASECFETFKCLK